MEREEFLRFVGRQKALEREIVSQANESVERVKNPLVKELIRGIALDSMKHENILSAIEARMAGSTPFLTEEERDAIRGAIERHIEMEREAIERYSEVLKGLEDERLRFLIEYILEDERRHHALLLRIQKLVVEPETLTDQDLAYIMWFDALFHGTPGG